MKQGFMLTRVQCQACQWSVNVQANIMPDIKSIQGAASQLHKASGVICGDPALVLIYVNVLFSNKLIQHPNAIITPNGNSAGHDQRPDA